MKRIVALLSLLAFPGCGNTPTLNSTVTGLRPGIYTGDIVCEGTITDATGTVPIQDVYAGRRVIGESGLPVESGLEVREGNMVELEFGGITATGVIDTVTVTPNGVVVDSSGSFVSDVCTDTNCTSVEMIITESLKASGQNSIEVSSLITMFASLDGQTGSASAICTGVLSQ
jgi:hypothetical protein